MKVNPQKVTNWLLQKGMLGQCSCCGKRDGWLIVDDVMQVSPFTGGNLIVGGPVHLYVGMACKNCADTKFFNVNLMGDVFDSASTGNGSSVPAPVMPTTPNPPHQPTP